MGYYMAGDYYQAGGKVGPIHFKKGLLHKGLRVGKHLLKHHLAAGGHKRYRRMHPGNVKALHRAMRRVNSFAKLAKRTITFTHHVRMKKRRRS